MQKFGEMIWNDPYINYYLELLQLTYYCINLLLQAFCTAVELVSELYLLQNAANCLIRNINE